MELKIMQKGTNIEKTELPYCVKRVPVFTPSAFILTFWAFVRKFSPGFLLVWFLFASHTLFAQSAVTIDLPQPVGDNFIESALISNVSVVPLQIETPRAITEDMEMKYVNNNYFILDNRFKQCVYHFDAEGKFVNKIGEKTVSENAGDVPVLTNPVKFCVDPYRHEVSVFNFEEMQIQRYTYEGKKLDMVKIDLDPADFICNNKGNYIVYTGWNNKASSYRVLFMDHNMKPIDKKLRLISKCMPIQSPSFYDAGNAVCMWELFGDRTYRISNTDIIPSFIFDFGQFKLPENYHNMLAAEGMQELMKNGYFTTKKYLENDQFAYFFLNYTSPDQREMIHVIYDKKAKKTYVLNENAGIGAFDKAQALTSDNELIFLVSPRKVRQLLGGGSDYMPDVFTSLDEQIKDIRNPMILKIKLQSPDDAPVQDVNGDMPDSVSR
jgi:hypothetical protein